MPYGFVMAAAKAEKNGYFTKKKRLHFISEEAGFFSFNSTNGSIELELFFLTRLSSISTLLFHENHS